VIVRSISGVDSFQSHSNALAQGPLCAQNVDTVFCVFYRDIRSPAYFDPGSAVTVILEAVPERPLALAGGSNLDVQTGSVLISVFDVSEMLGAN